MKQDTEKDAPAREPLPLLDGLTGWAYYVESSERVYELLDVYGIPRPGSPGKIPGLMGGFKPVSAEDSYFRLTMALARDFVPSCKPVRPNGPLAEIAIAKAAESGRPKPRVRPGKTPRYQRGELLLKVAEHMTRTGQSMTASLDDLFGENAATPDPGSLRGFHNIRKEHPDLWAEILAGQQAQKVAEA
jgi:hypothetical protein